MKHSLPRRSSDTFHAFSKWFNLYFPKAKLLQNGHVPGEHFLFWNLEKWSKSSTRKVSTHSPDLLKADWDTPPMPRKPIKGKTTDCTCCSGLSYTCLFLCVKLHKYFQLVCWVEASGKMLQLKSHLGESTAPGWVHQAKLWGAAPGQVVLTLHLTSGLWQPKAAGEDLGHHRGPIPPCLLQK